MFILHEDASVRSLLAARLVDEGDRGIVGGKRFEDVFTILAAPDFNYVMKHRFVFLVTRAEGVIDPGNRYFISNSGRRQYRCRLVISCLYKFCPRIPFRQVPPIPIDLEEISVHPTMVASIHINPVPVVCIGAADQDDVGIPVQGVEIQVFRTRPITAGEESFRDHFCPEAFDRWDGRGNGCIGGSWCAGGCRCEA